MFIEFVQFSLNAIVFLIMLRMAQAKLKDTEWGKAAAFLG